MAGYAAARQFFGAGNSSEHDPLAAVRPQHNPVLHKRHRGISEADLLNFDFLIKLYDFMAGARDKTVGAGASAFEKDFFMQNPASTTETEEV